MVAIQFAIVSARADFWDEQIKPVSERAFDPTSRRLVLAGFGSVLWSQSLDSSARDQWRGDQMMSKDLAKAGDNFSRDAIGPIIALGQLYFDPENGASHARALISTALVTHGLKPVLQRRRPNGSNNHSMPSGHASNAFATATALSYSYGWKVGVPAFAAAGIVGMSRLADDMHWFSDVVAGAFIGVWMGRASSYSVRELSSQQTVSWSLLPILQAQYQGLQLQVEF